MVDHSERALLVREVMAAFGLQGTIKAWGLAARSANGETWRLDLHDPDRSFAVKRAVRDATSEEQVRAEVAYRDAAVSAGICAPSPVAAASGAYVMAIAGAPVRISSWVPGKAPLRADPGRSEWLGDALGTLHSLDYPTHAFPAVAGGGVPDPSQWCELAQLAAADARPWAEQLASAVPVLQAIGAGWTDDRDTPRVVSHRDVQPSNVIFNPDRNSYTLVDWDGVGLVNPARELTSRLITWHVHNHEIDRAGIDRTMRAYRQSGGTAVLKPADAYGGAPDALGYLGWQVRLSLDSTASQATRTHASAEVQALLDEPSPPGVLDAVIEVARRY